MSAVQKSRQKEEMFRQKKDELAAIELHQLDQQLDSFKQKLEEFASKHKKDIQKNPDFRKKFQVSLRLCGIFETFLNSVNINDESIIWMCDWHIVSLSIDAIVSLFPGNVREHRSRPLSVLERFLGESIRCRRFLLRVVRANH